MVGPAAVLSHKCDIPCLRATKLHNNRLPVSNRLQSGESDGMDDNPNVVHCASGNCTLQNHSSCVVEGSAITSKVWANNMCIITSTLCNKAPDAT